VTRVVWSAPARADLRAIRAYIARDSARYAGAVVEQLLAVVSGLAAFPLSGRMVPELGQATVREVIDGGYRIVYRVTPDEVQVVAVVHTARRFPVLPTP
jgi:toxin ParE1/3/4